MNQAENEGKLEQTPSNYLVTEVYSIRKESMNNANDQIYKKLGKKFQHIKKQRADTIGTAHIAAEYNYDQPAIRRDFKKLHQLYNSVSKAHLIVKRKIDKVRSKVERIKTEVERGELKLIRDVDLQRLYTKPCPPVRMHIK